MQTPLTPQKIGPQLMAAAAAAMGGVPTRPPAVSPVAEASGLADAREAYAASHMQPAPPPPLGSPLFDPPAPEITDRRAAVAGIRSRLAELARGIRDAQSALEPALADLATHSRAVETEEKFSVSAARAFLAALGRVVDGTVVPADVPVAALADAVGGVAMVTKRANPSK